MAGKGGGGKKDLKILITASLNEQLSKTELQAKLDKIAPELELKLKNMKLDFGAIDALNKKLESLLTTMKKVEDVTGKINSRKIDITGTGTGGKTSDSIYKNLTQRALEIEKATGKLAQVTMQTKQSTDDIVRASLTYTDKQGRQVTEIFRQVEQEKKKMEGSMGGEHATTQWQLEGKTIKDNIALTEKLNAKRKETLELLNKIRKNDFMSLDEKRALTQTAKNSSDIKELTEIKNKTEEALSAQQKYNEEVRKQKEALMAEKKELKEMLDVLKNIGAINEENYRKMNKQVNYSKDIDNLKNYKKQLNSIQDEFNKKKDTERKYIEWWQKQQVRLEQEERKRTDKERQQREAYINWWIQQDNKLRQSEQKRHDQYLQNLAKERAEARKMLEGLKNGGGISQQQYGVKMQSINNSKDIADLQKEKQVLESMNAVMERNNKSTMELRNAKKQFANELKQLRNEGKLTNDQFKKFLIQNGMAKAVTDVKQLKNELQSMKKYTADTFEDAQRRILNMAKAIEASHPKMFKNDVLGNQSKYKVELERIINDTKTLTRDSTNLESRLKALTRQMQDLTTKTKAEAGAMEKSGMDFSAMMQTAMVKFPVWMMTATMFYQPLRLLQSAVEQILLVDKQMTNFERVYDGMENRKEILQETYDIAEKLGNKMTEVNDIFVGFARQGFKGTDLSQMAEVATMMSNVSDLSGEEAMSTVTSAMKAFSIQAKDTMHIVDSLNEVDNKYAITTQDLAQALQKAGGTARTFGVTMEELLGHTTAIGEITRESGSVIGNSLKTIYSRITTMDGSVDILNNVGVAVYDMGGKVRDVGDILNDLGSKWGTLNSGMQQQIALQLAGR